MTITYDGKFYAYRSPSALIGKSLFSDLEHEQVFIRAGTSSYKPGLPGTEDNWISKPYTYYSEIKRYSHKKLHELLARHEINPRNIFCKLKYKDQQSEVECIFPARYINYKSKRSKSEYGGYIQIISGYTLIWAEQMPIVGYLAAAVQTENPSNTIIECVSSIYRDVGTCMAPEYRHVTVLEGNIEFFTYS